MAASAPVTLHVYDLTRGMAAQMSQAIIGERVEGIWHTGICFRGREYFFGGGIFYDAPGNTPYGTPTKLIPLGSSSRSMAEFVTFIASLHSDFTAATYHILRNNCNHFTNRCAVFLCGSGIPDAILNQHQVLHRSPLGATILPMIEATQNSIQQSFASNSHLQNPFGAATGNGNGNGNAGPAPNRAPITFTAPANLLKMTSSLRLNPSWPPDLPFCATAPTTAAGLLAASRDSSAPQSRRGVLDGMRLVCAESREISIRERLAEMCQEMRQEIEEVKDYVTVEWVFLWRALANAVARMESREAAQMEGVVDVATHFLSASIDPAADLNDVLLGHATAAALATLLNLLLRHAGDALICAAAQIHANPRLRNHDTVKAIAAICRQKNEALAAALFDVES